MPDISGQISVERTLEVADADLLVVAKRLSLFLRSPNVVIAGLRDVLLTTGPLPGPAPDRFDLAIEDLGRVVTCEVDVVAAEVLVVLMREYRRRLLRITLDDFLNGMRRCSMVLRTYQLRLNSCIPGLYVLSSRNMLIAF